MPLKKCLTCSALFNGRSDQAKCDSCIAAQRKTTLRPRTCRQCGAEFLGGPRAWYCPRCREERKKEATKRYRQRGPLRPIGSIDHCVICGAEYSVNGPRQMYCAACAPEAIRRVDRKQSIAWNNAHSADRTHEARFGQKICVICGKPIPRERMRCTCSPECEKKRKSHAQAVADYARGRRTSMPKLSRLDDALRPQAGEESPPPEMEEIRRATGLSQAAFAARHGIPRRSLENWEDGSAKCAAWLQQLLAEVEGLAPLPAPIAAAVGTPGTLPELRQQLGLSKAAFAARHGIPYGTVVNWERPGRGCAHYVLQLLTEVETLACTSSQQPRPAGSE